MSFVGATLSSTATCGSVMRRRSIGGQKKITLTKEEGQRAKTKLHSLAFLGQIEPWSSGLKQVSVASHEHSRCTLLSSFLVTQASLDNVAMNTF